MKNTLKRDKNLVENSRFRHWVGMSPPRRTDYSPFGVLLPERTSSTAFYRRGFQGQEHDDEVKGDGNSVNFKYRMHDPRLGRFFAVDPLVDQRAWMAPYNFVQNSPMMRIDPDGRLDDWVGCINEDGTTSYHWNENITSEAQAKDLGYDAYKDAGSLITGSIGGGPTGRIFLGTNEAHYLMPQNSSPEIRTTQLPNPFLRSNIQNPMSQAYAPKGSANSLSKGNTQNPLNAGLFDFSGSDLIGPSLIMLGSPLYPKPGGVGGGGPSGKWTSVASKSLRWVDDKIQSKVLNTSYKFPAKGLIHRTLGVRGVGAAAGRLVPYVGWGITTWDVFYSLGVQKGPSTWYGDNDTKYFE